MLNGSYKNERSTSTTASTGQKSYAHVIRSEEHTSELQSRPHIVCRLLLEKKNTEQPRIERRRPRRAEPARRLRPLGQVRRHVRRGAAELFRDGNRRLLGRGCRQRPVHGDA